MTLTTAVVENAIISNVTSWQSANLSVGVYKELTCDIHMTALGATCTCAVYRIPPTGLLELLFERLFYAPGFYAFDLGHFDLIDGTTPDLNACTFGQTIQIHIISPAAFSGTCSIKGKGAV